MMAKQKGIKRLYAALRYSLQGLCHAWRGEAAFRQESVLLLAAIVLVCWLDLGAIQRILLIGTLLLVMIVELINSAIEAVVDRIGSDYHALSGQAKDLGSAAVLVAIVLAVFVWLALLWQPLQDLFS